jgi:predicted ribosome quality control (RQC) complex YloA/Tae2 family protein
MMNARSHLDRLINFYKEVRKTASVSKKKLKSAKVSLEGMKQLFVQLEWHTEMLKIIIEHFQDIDMEGVKFTPTVRENMIYTSKYLKNVGEKTGVKHMQSFKEFYQAVRDESTFLNNKKEKKEEIENSLKKLDNFLDRLETYSGPLSKGSPWGKIKSASTGMAELLGCSPRPIYPKSTI